MTATIEQETLWGPDVPPAPKSRTRAKPKAPEKPRRTPRHPAQEHWHPVDCLPTCLVCERPEGFGICPKGECAVVCGTPRPRRKDGKAPVDVCLLQMTDHVTATPAPGGGYLAYVICPGCGQLHWHGGTTTQIRVGPCGTPYVVHHPREER
ncbi:hypothetical protein GCM10009555_017920 [Acrocarpospora macrocephala]|uniref:Uncharacterized protein n=1 Tax=Acrocarpospora macrocephala TaxID=150177 RepID=A0A5M3WH53_9ACTN|nr:hypothetical protein [Acrocarpospora macrocephala]GES07452.1 hypothetical protein Amac_010470 [Acrocarpospora macrocephala]